MPPLKQGSSGVSSPGGGSGRAYWRSLDHLADTAEFREFMFHEFPAGAAGMLESDDRRHFLKIMGASMALAGLGMSGCRRWPDQEIAPYASRPVGRDPGVPAYFASAFELNGVASGVVVTSEDGRPTKIEGNADHPASRGAASAFAQASVLDLYDPDRSRSVMHAGAATDWASFVAWVEPHFQGLRSNGGTGLAVLSEASSSPSLELLRQQFLATYPNATWHEYEPINNDNEVAGAELAFGRPYRAQLDLEKARVVVSLDADLLGGSPNAVANIRGFAASRRSVDFKQERGTIVDAPGQGHISRWYAFESDMSLTGANADERAAVRSADVLVVAAHLAAEITGDDTLRTGQLDEAARKVFDHAVADLRSREAGPSLVVAGSRQPAVVHYLVHLVNEAIGAVGATVSYTAPSRQPKHAASIAALTGKSVDTLVILGGNPVYNAPADVRFGAWLGSVPNAIHLGTHVDETSQQCAWHVNRAHALESWGDARAWDGTYTPCQPLIEPLFQSRSAIELIALVTGDQLTSGRAIVQRTFEEMIGGADEPAWRTTLHDGLLSTVAGQPESSAYTLERPRVDRNAASAVKKALAERSATSGYEVVFTPDPTVWDGRFANNGWLQETPDPITKLTWDNAALMSPATARGLGVSSGDMISIQAGGVTLEAPARVQPGMAEGSITLSLGYGRAFEGRICAGAGVNAYVLRSTGSMGFVEGATIARASGTYKLASTQDHHTIDVETVGGRGVQARLPSLFREADLPEYEADPRFASHRTHVVHRLSQWEETNLEGAQYAWGMAVDLNACVGCGACVVACQAENNIPIVGKDQVLMGREMHWIRIDRYFRFGEHGGHYDPDDVDAVALQPVMCMQCENAPCEQVCPVAATVHDEDGLNVMVYNRCIGTRYCSNNCPYKVRRFNYFDYHRRDPHREQPGTLLQVEASYWTKPAATPDEPKRLQFNPEVSVRMRGVMEKCTYCTQRIQDAKINAKNAYAQRPESEKEQLKHERVPVADGAITPACAQTCPAGALVFGDLNDPTSRVAKLQHKNPRTYEMLEELNVEARTKYMARIRNPVEGSTGQGGQDGHGGHGGGAGNGDGGGDGHG